MTEKKKRGPKLTQIDQKIFEGLLKIQCTTEELESILCCDHETIDRWCQRTYGRKFTQVSAEMKSQGKASLRRSQWLKGVDQKDTGMLIWLGKQYLGQSNDPIVEEKSEEKYAFPESMTDQ